ncbi:MAG: hypothetical protein D6728_11525 [Cyanobacteria bacterium J055]|nr:MAG: hypothetical protein D6728_11525 [Cyanobacteria bacterium J055]
MGKLSDFSTVQLFHFFNAWVRDVEIVANMKIKSQSQDRSGLLLCNFSSVRSLSRFHSMFIFGLS